jgi:hypothetical protein
MLGLLANEPDATGFVAKSVLIRDLHPEMGKSSDGKQ